MTTSQSTPTQEPLQTQKTAYTVLPKKEEINEVNPEDFPIPGLDTLDIF